MLDHARAANYEIGADLKGAEVAEVWPLALPVDAGEAVCVGVDASSRARVALESAGWRCSIVAPDDHGSHRPARLVWLDTSTELRDWSDRVGELVAPDGVVVARDATATVLRERGWRDVQRLWCAPSASSPVVIAPADDDRTIRYFAARELGDPDTIVPSVGGGTVPAPRGEQLAVLSREAPRSPTGPPPWLQDVAADGGVDIGRHRWGMWARRHYASQKVLVFLFEPDSPTPSIVVKLPRDRRFNARIEHDHRAIEVVHGLAGQQSHVPAPCFVGDHAGRRVAAVAAVEGTPFPYIAGSERHGRLTDHVVRWLGELGALTARPVRSAELGPPLHEVVSRVVELFPLTSNEAAALRRHVDVLTTDVDELPVVLQHGNVTDWNLIVRPDGEITFLDWELAEPNGLPLWDLYFFLRHQDWPLATGWRRRLYGRWRPQRDLFLHPDGAHTTRPAIEAYRRCVDVPSHAIEPLFHLCWAHQCLNAATHATEERLVAAPMFRLLRRGLSMGEQGRLQPFLLAR